MKAKPGDLGKTDPAFVVPPPKKIFLHVCCGPCAAFPLEWLIEQSPEIQVFLWYYNPNIHPKSEYLRRRDSLAYLALASGRDVEFAPYEPEDFIKSIGDQTSAPDRCARCYALRLNRAAQEASLRGFPALATTLAFSRRQKHELIVQEGQRAAEKYGLNFYYQDWRPGWQRGHELARTLGLYRQNYCGCLYSEFER